MDIGRLISVNDGRTYGLSDTELFHDENLAAICAECNAGQGSETFPLPFLMAVLTLPPSFLTFVVRVRIAARCASLAHSKPSSI